MFSRKPTVINPASSERLHGNARACDTGARRAHAGARSRVRWWPGVLTSLLCGLAALPAQAQQSAQAEPQDGVEACLAHHLSGQELRQQSKLLESREQFRQCARPECPGAIARDCVEWLGQYERRIPSVAVRVTADGAGRPDARVFVDGVQVVGLNGKAIELNPGEHAVRVELEPFAPYETSLLVSEGDQFRIVEASFVTPRPLGGSSQPESVPATPVVTERPIPTLVYVFGAVTLAAAGNSVGWGLYANSLRQDLEDTCAAYGCQPKHVKVLRQRALVTDISWGVTAASLVTTVALYALRPEVVVEQEQPIAFGLDLVPGGAVGSVSLTAF